MFLDSIKIALNPNPRYETFSRGYLVRVSKVLAASEARKQNKKNNNNKFSLFLCCKTRHFAETSSSELNVQRMWMLVTALK